jgi:outer membrane murein-binding lipoprotein Lpp
VATAQATAAHDRITRLTGDRDQLRADVTALREEVTAVRADLDHARTETRDARTAAPRSTGRRKPPTTQD